MKILKQEKKGNQVILEIEEEYSKLVPLIQEAYQEASKEVKIPGFRSGKIPADVLKKYLNEDAMIDRAIQLLIADIYPEVIDSSGIKPVDYPSVEVKQLKEKTPIILNIKVDVSPDVKLGNYKGLHVKKMDATVQEAEIDSTLEAVRKSYAAQSKIPEAELPLDDEFARKVSTSSTLLDLKAIIRANIEEEKKREAEHAVKDEITRKLSEVVEVDVPAGMIDREIEHMVNDLEFSLKRSRMTLQSYLSAVKKDIDKLKEEMKPSALIRVKAKLALETIAEKEKLEIEPGELDKELEVLAQQSGKTLEEYRAEVSETVLESVKDFMLKEKAIDFVVSKAKVEG